MSRRLVILLAGLALAVVAGAMIMFAPAIREVWYLRELRSGDEKRQMVAAGWLAERGSTRAVPRLLEIFRREDAGSHEIGYSGRALMKLGPRARSATGELALMLGKEESVWRASLVLKEIGEPAVPALLEALDDEHRVCAALLVLGEIGPPARPAVAGVIELLVDDSEHVRNLAYEALAGIGFAAYPGLIEASRDEDPKIREASVEAIGLYWLVVPDREDGTDLPPEIQDIVRPAVIRLIQALDDLDENVRAASAEALYWFEYDKFESKDLQKKASAKLQDLMENDPDAAVRIAARKALRVVRDLDQEEVSGHDE